MNTRSKLRSGGQEAVRDGDNENFDSLIRPSIKSSKRFIAKGAEAGDDDNNTKTIQDKMTGLGENTKFKTSLSGGVSSDGRNKMNIPNSSKPASVKKIIKEEDDSTYSDNEAESSEGELEPTSGSKINKTLLKDYAYEVQGDPHRLSSLRSRKDVKNDPLDIKPNRYDNTFAEKKEFSHKQAPKKGEEDKPQTSIGSTFWILIIALIVIFLGVCILVLKNPSTLSAEKQQLQVMNAFQDKFRKLQILFSGQSSDLWHRSQRILELQLRHGNENKEPAIILLTAAQDAKQMLYCVGNHLAKTYASALNSSYTILSGTDMPSEDSEVVKMDIDQRLNAGFQGNSKAAVLHRLELLPPGSLIILYKYCDHENAAFKNVALVLTVLLNDSTLRPDIGLNELEETVYDFLKETFITQGMSRTSHNEMDGDKLGGVWSRISHVVLPVFPAKQNVKECDESKASP
ncbi:torsin-1A-interacting protein 2-like isoform X5 [Aquarana catesbeiana]|uniref:torsin-1A-interacting protein 2-like isoform X5 n=1 Tax=Aquarana catesbeiana TaxID=8400 RepID=UPI003CC98876